MQRSECAAHSECSIKVAHGKWEERKPGITNSSLEEGEIRGVSFSLFIYSRFPSIHIYTNIYVYAHIHIFVVGKRYFKKEITILSLDTVRPS